MLASSAPLFGIRVIDDATGRGVPLVELETVNHLLYVTDSAGWAAVDAPELFGTEIYFHVRSHGYAYPKDGFGYAGVRLRVTPGGRATVKVKRENVAERLCRLTGGGIYADSALLGERAPLKDPLRPGNVLGQDSALAVRYRGRMLWFWGDTNRAAYPLGNFRTTGAVATLPAGHATADAGLDFAYFTGPDGFAREMIPSTKPGPIWIFGLVTVGEPGREELYAHYSRMERLDKRLEHGWVRWDDGASVFRIVREQPNAETWRYLDGHPTRWTDAGRDYLAGGFSFPVVRVPADRDRLLDPAAYEAFTCLAPNGDVRRGPDGVPLYAWQKDVPPITPPTEADLIQKGKLRPEQARFLPRDPEGKPVIVHGACVTWNPWRKRWLLIGTRRGGKDSLLGELWYSEAASPTGPWRRAVRIVTHDRYTFYNPVHHPFLDAAGGRIVHFEGTYTASFSGSEARPTPRYDYNQMLYRLDLADPRLAAAREG